MAQYVFNLDLHPTQLQVYNDPHKHKVVAAGKGWGKTNLVTKSGAGIAMTTPDSQGAVIAPFAKQANYDYKMIKKYIPKNRIESTSERWLTFNLTNGAEISMFSGENPEGIRGFAWDWAIVDEAAFCDSEVIDITDSQVGKRNGIAWYISTPHGKGVFYDLYCRKENDPENYESFHFTTYDNPHYPRAEIERMRKAMPELVFRQEILAEFIEGGVVFPKLAEVMTALPREPIQGHSYVAAADIAKSEDFTVVKVFDTSDNNEVYHFRFNDRSWESIRTQIYTICKRYNNALLIIDKTGVGSAVVEDLQKMEAAYPGAQNQGNLNIVPFTFSSKMKPELFSNYLVAQENLTIRLINDPVTRKEHEDLVTEVTQNGYTKYHALKGRHDDTVIASALAAWALEKICKTSEMIGPYTKSDFVKKKPIDPATQIDVDAIIRKLDRNAVANYGTPDDDENIVRSFDEM